MSETELVPHLAEGRMNMRRWFAAMELSHAALMAGLRAEVGPDGDIEEAYRRWNRRRMEIKDREYDRIAERHRRAAAED